MLLYLLLVVMSLYWTSNTDLIVVRLSISTRALKCWDNPSINLGFSNGAEIDIKIEETFSEEDLVTFLKNYADQKASAGGNIMSSTSQT